MRNIWLVTKHDIGVTLRQRSFWILTMLMPLLLMAINAFSVIQDSDATAANREAARREESVQPGDLSTIGLVDEAGLIAEMPPGIPTGLFVPYADAAQAQAALENGDVAQYVHIPIDYIASGEVTVYDQDFQIMRSGENMGVGFGSDNEWVLRYLIEYNLVGDVQLLTALRNPTPGKLAEMHALTPSTQVDEEDQALAELVASVLPYVYYFLLVMGGNYLMRAVVSEKENRTAEVLLLSLHPNEMMIGKIIAMSAVTMIQVVVWVGGGLLILNRGAELMSVATFHFPPGFVVWAILFLVLGYLLYASVMAAAGAIAPTAREGAQVIWLLILPLMPVLMFGRVFLEEPHGTLSLVLSLFPFSAPAAMVTRLAVAQVPLWQILLSLGGLALTAYLFVALAGRFFRAGNLLSDASFSWKRLATGWHRG